MLPKCSANVAHIYDQHQWRGSELRLGGTAPRLTLVNFTRFSYLSFWFVCYHLSATKRPTNPVFDAGTTATTTANSFI